MSPVLAPQEVTAEIPVTPPPAGRHRWHRPDDQPAWVRPAVGALGALTLLLYSWNLARNGMGNAYYAAAVKSGTESWKAFFFGSIDPGSSITVDKPPAAFWIQALSARAFGFSSWSILLPQAVAGTAAVLVVYRLVARWTGRTAGLLAGVALALTPVAAVMFRFNNPDGFMTLFLVLAAWATWAAVESGCTRHLVIAGVLVGLAFDTKMLEAFVTLPALGLVYLWAGPPRLGRRIVQLLYGGLALVASAGWWVAVVALWPALDRPYIGSTTDNSILSLIFGYNGLSRIFGSSHGAGGAGARGGGQFGGSASWLRLFSDSLGGQVAWLLPLALGGLVIGLWLTRRAPRTDRTRAGWLLWGGWALAAGLVFSKAQGTFHPYYTVALAPAVAALAAGGAVALGRLGAMSRSWSWTGAVAVGGSAAWAVVLLRRTPGYDSPLVWGIAVGGAVAAVALVVGPWTGRRLVVGIGSVIAGLTLLAGPAAYAMTTVNTSVTGSLASAGPSAAGRQGGAGGFAGFRGRDLGGLVPGGSPGGNPGGGPGEGPGGSGLPFGGFGGIPSAGAAAGGGRFGGAGGFGRAGGFGGIGGAPEADTSLDSFLEANRDGATWLVAVQGASAAEPIILATGQAVVAMGGFSGSDPFPTVAQLSSLVGSHQLRYVLLGGGGFGGARGGSTSAVTTWVKAHGHVVDYGNSTAGTLYQVTTG